MLPDGVPQSFFAGLAPPQSSPKEAGFAPAGAPGDAFGAEEEDPVLYLVIVFGGSP